MPTRISSPWVRLYREIQAMFAEDKQVKVVLDDTNVNVYVEDEVKADAIEKILKALYVFGNVTSMVTVYPANNCKSEEKYTYDSVEALYKTAFENNPALSYVAEYSTVFGSMAYVVFANKVVQYFNDDLGDVNGMCSTLYQDIAKDIFRHEPNTFYCTDTPENLGKPLGEWP